MPKLFSQRCGVLIDLKDLTNRKQSLGSTEVPLSPEYCSTANPASGKKKHRESRQVAVHLYFKVLENIKEMEKHLLIHM